MDDGLIDKPPVMGSNVGKAKGFSCNMQLKTLGIKVFFGFTTTTARPTARAHKNGQLE